MTALPLACTLVLAALLGPAATLPTAAHANTEKDVLPTATDLNNAASY